MPRTFALILIAVFGMPTTSYAHGPGTHGVDIETEEGEIIVHGRNLKLIGEAAAASEGIVGYADFEDRTLSRTGELTEVIPGVVATQHSGEGKANQYFLRGFNLDHGTDFSASVDGVPMNLRTHGHGQGYLDFNFIIPELIEQVAYRKGPYRASSGDFSSAGSARYVTRDELTAPFAKLTIGEKDYLRGVTATALDLSPETKLILALEGQSYNGPWVLDQNLSKLNAVAKIVHDNGPWHLSATASAYRSEWDSTDQVPLRAVESGQIDRFGFIDDDLGGDTTRFSLNGQANYLHRSGAVTDMSAYFVSYDFSLFSNFTYFLDDPVRGDEFEQIDQRNYFGFGVSHAQDVTERLKLRLGSDLRFDDISDIGLFKTESRQRFQTVRRDSVEELSIALWGEAEFALTSDLRAQFGVRGDYFSADVNAVSEPRNSGSADDTLLSPSFGLAWKASESVELYANYGQGFHSNDVRGATIAFDPQSGDPVEQVPILVKSKGAEIGARYQRGPIHATLAVFTLDLDSELVFVGDAGTTEANDASSRMGVETSLFWRPNDWLTLDVAAAYTDSEFDIPGADNKIPNTVKSVIGGGFTADFEPWIFGARLRHFGEAPLIEDGSVTSEPTTLVNLTSSYNWQDVTLSLELLNAFDANDADITYFFESRLAGEANPVEDIHFHPVEPRALRATIHYRF